jgi:hypothetical protein
VRSSERHCILWGETKKFIALSRHAQSSFWCRWPLKRGRVMGSEEDKALKNCNFLGYERRKSFNSLKFM